MTMTSSFYSPDYTYSYDKYSCVRTFYFVHLVFNYLIFLSGIVCFVTRLAPPRYRYLHPWFGRIYILSMLWSTVASLLINNTGLPLSTIVSFGAVMVGLTIGWIAIVVHKEIMEGQAQLLVQQRLVDKLKVGMNDNNDDNENLDLTNMLGEAKMDVVNSKTFAQRFFSLKALHGTLFFVSWMQITGRIFFSNQSGDFTCHTYPVYKQIDALQIPESAKDELTVVPATDPDYDQLPWAAPGPVAWAMQIILGSMFFAIVVGAFVSWRASIKAQRMRSEDSGIISPSSEDDDQDEQEEKPSRDREVQSSRRATIGNDK